MRLPIKKQPSPNWRTVFQREMYYSADEEYAKHLQLLISNPKCCNYKAVIKEIKKNENKFNLSVLLFIPTGFFLIFGSMMYFCTHLDRTKAEPYLAHFIIASYTLNIVTYMISRKTQWSSKPLISDILTALREATLARSQGSEGSDYLADMIDSFRGRLESRISHPEEIEKLLASFGSNSWKERMTACYAAVALGGEAVAPLMEVMQRPTRNKNEKKKSLLARWCLCDIARETTVQLAARFSQWICPHCLTRYQRKRMRFSPFSSLVYYGCRICSQSRVFLECREVVAVLETGGEEQSLQDGILRVNWLKRQALFDFDRVEILNAPEQEVERFAVQIGNDTDRYRQARYQRMAWHIGAGCQLSENTLRILRSLFGQAERAKGQLTAQNTAS